MGKPAEILLFDFLTEQMATAVFGDVLFEAELHDTIYQTITKPRCVRIGEPVGDFAPDVGGVMKEFDVVLQIVCLARVEGKNQKDRQPAVQIVFDMQQTVCQWLSDGESLGDRVCSIQLMKGFRGFESYDNRPYAMAAVPVIINPT